MVEILKPRTRAEQYEINRKEHAERLQAARDEAEASKLELLDAHMMNDDYSHAIARLIDAKVTLALLERGGG